MKAPVLWLLRLEGFPKWETSFYNDITEIPGRDVGFLEEFAPGRWVYGSSGYPTLIYVYFPQGFDPNQGDC